MHDEDKTLGWHHTGAIEQRLSFYREDVRSRRVPADKPLEEHKALRTSVCGGGLRDAVNCGLPESDRWMPVERIHDDRDLPTERLNVNGGKRWSVCEYKAPPAGVHALKSSVCSEDRSIC